MYRHALLGLVAIMCLSGCARNAQTDLAVKKFLVGYDGLTCTEVYQANLDDGETREYAETQYNACLAKRS